MKYAIANKQGIVYTIRDTNDGFDPAKTKGETCIPLKEEHGEVKPHFQYHPAQDKFAPRIIDPELKEELHQTADGILAQHKEEVNQKALQALGLALLDGVAHDGAIHSAMPNVENKSIKQWRQEQHQIAEDNNKQHHQAIDVAQHYYQVPKALRYDANR